MKSFIRYERVAQIPELGAERRHVAIRRPGLRIYAIDTTNIVYESRVFTGAPHIVALPAGEDDMAHLVIVLRGQLVARRRGKELVASKGHALLDPTSFLDERWEGPLFSALCLQWSDAYGARPLSPQVKRLSMRVEEASRAVAEGLRRDRLDDITVSSWLRALRAEGIPLHARTGARADALDDAPLPAHQLASAVSWLHSHLDAHPDLSDAERLLGLSSRQFRRRMSAQGPWYVTRDAEWRQSLRRTRMMLAPSLATARGATVEQVARAVGYRSASALLFALAEEGVPSLAVARKLSSG